MKDRIRSALPFIRSNGQSKDGLATMPSSDDFDVSPEAEKRHEVLRGRYEFTQAFGDLAQGKRNWQVTAFIALALLAIVSSAFVYRAMSSRVTPYVVEVNELGQARAFGPAKATNEASERIVIAELSSFIRNVRAVYSDPAAQKDMIYRAYSHATTEARQFLESYFSDPEHDPRALADDFSRSAQVQSVTRLPDSNTYKVKWTETKQFESGDTEKSAWEAYLTVKQVPPKSADMMKYNPLGIMVTDIQWSEITGADLSTSESS